MNSQEFILWLKGFTEGVHEYNITPKQWDLLKERLAQVKEDDEFVETPGMFQVHPQPAYPGVPLGVPNTWQHPHYVDPLNPYKVTCDGTGTANHDLVVRTSGYLSASYIDHGTSTARYPHPNATITYTTNGAPNWYSSTKVENNSGNK